MEKTRGKATALFALTLLVLILAGSAWTKKIIINLPGQETAGKKLMDLPDVGPGDFVSIIDNKYMPLQPGATYVYKAEEDELIRNEITVTHDTTVVAGVTCTVVHDVEKAYVEELGVWEILEDTYDWYAQDKYGNVWYFGEDTTEYIYDDQWNLIETSDEGSWEAGVDGAKQGIVMLADPAPGVSYRQEYYEDEAEDMGKILRLNATVSVAYGSFTNCLKTKEWTQLDHGVIEHKYYAPNVGLVLINELKGKTVRVELIEVTTEGP
jgi:hypothetical protein